MDLQVKIIDFGLAKITTPLEQYAVPGQTRSAHSQLAQQVFGTFDYSPPEQWENTEYRQVTEKSDVFALGKTLYRLFSNKRPQHNIRQKYLPYAPNLHELLEDCVEDDPVDRPDVATVLNSLMAFQHQTKGIGIKKKQQETIEDQKVQELGQPSISLSKLLIIVVIIFIALFVTIVSNNTNYPSLADADSKQQVSLSIDTEKGKELSFLADVDDEQQVSFSIDAENGKTLYQTYCIACHTIGEGRLVGPDLNKVVSRRELSWLIRWIQEPDKMFAEGDPIATQLVQEYHNLPMPNFGLSKTQVTDIIAYIQAVEADLSEIEMNTSAPTEEIASTEEKTTEPTMASTDLALAKGEEIYNTACALCHSPGIAHIPKAPEFGNKEDWAPRIAQGMETLYSHALNGFQGATGIMPPKGGFTHLPDEDIKAAVAYMVSKAQ